MNFSAGRFVVLPFLLLVFAFASLAQDNSAKADLYNKISKASQSKKPDEQAKGYELGKIYLAKYGKDGDDGSGKVKKFVESYRLNAFNKALEETRIADAASLGREMLAENPNDVYVPMNLAYGGYDAMIKKQDKSFAADSINYARQTLAALDSGNAPPTFAPFKTKDEATAMMHYVIAYFSAETDPKNSAGEYYKTVQFDSPVRKNSYPYFALANYYEQLYQKAANDYQTKYAARTSEDAEMKQAQANINKIVDLMLDAYVRAVSVAGGEPNNQNKAGWQTRLAEIYKFRYQKTEGLDEFSQKILATPLPDPAVL